MRSCNLVVLFLAVLLLVAVGCERKLIDETETKIIAASGATYIGSAQCGDAACHQATYNDFQNTGHPYKLNEAEEAQVAGYYPYTEVPDPPSGVAWTDVDKIIGGFWWKARFIGNDGYIFTGDSATGLTQYNLVDSSWSAYHAGEPDLSYDCGPCHMTAYKAIGNQEDKAGLVGTWEFNGVQCEECHGPGSVHAADPYNIAMKIDRSSEQCGKCHIRGDVGEIPASGGFIKHHEQWNEMFTTKHKTLQCVDCHDPHIGLHPSNPDRARAIKIDCEGCHFEEAESFLNSGITEHQGPGGPSCTDCHMPKAAKSAAADPNHRYRGDVTSHLFRINTAADAEMFTPDGKWANGYLTVEYSCLWCHQETADTKSWAAENANLVHSSPITDVTACFTCHSDVSFGLLVAAIEEQYTYSIHSSGANTDRNRMQAPYYQACEKCHTSEGFVAEVTGVPASGDHFSAIGCFTCHAPHTGGTFAVRTQDPVTLGNGSTYDKGKSNLCVNCHMSRRDVNTYVVDSVNLSTHFGPHLGNQGDMLIAANAYEFAGYDYDTSAHATVTVDGCLDCHMSTAFHSSIGNHAWNMRNEESGFENISGCNTTNCHNGAVSTLDLLAEGDFDSSGVIEGIQTEIHGLMDTLRIELLAAELLVMVVDGSDTIYHANDTLTVGGIDSVGALYNWIFIEEDRSFGVHNTDYAVGLLQSSLNYIVHKDPNGVAGRRDILSNR